VKATSKNGSSFGQSTTNNTTNITNVTNIPQNNADSK